VYRFLNFSQIFFTKKNPYLHFLQVRKFFTVVERRGVEPLSYKIYYLNLYKLSILFGYRPISIFIV